MKTKKILKTAAIILLTILIILAGYIIYLYASYHRIEDNKKLEVKTVSENDKEGDTLSAFGSHACFYTDATLLSSQSAGIDNMEHALTQLPYVIIASVLSVVGFMICGFVM